MIGRSMFDIKDNKPYCEKVRSTPFLSPAEELELVREYRRTGNSDARDRVILSNQKFIIKEAFKYSSNRVSAEDLIQVANIGLMRAFNKFDPEKGFRFLTYARWWIRAELSNYLYANDAILKGGQTQTQRKLWFKIIRLMIGLLDDGNSEEEAFVIIAKMDKVPVSAVRSAYALRSSCVIEYLDIGASPLPSPEEIADVRERERLATSLANIECSRDIEGDIIFDYLACSDPVPMGEIGSRYGLSRERVRQIKNELLDRMRAAA